MLARPPSARTEASEHNNLNISAINQLHVHEHGNIEANFVCVCLCV